MQAFADQQSKLPRQTLPTHLFSVHQMSACLVTNLQQLNFPGAKKPGTATQAGHDPVIAGEEWHAR